MGRWVNNPRFGRQIEFQQAEELLPATSEGIRLYLASGLIKGVGEEMAGRIVQAFGTDTIRILDEEPERLLKVRGVGSKSLDRIRTCWAEHRGMAICGTVMCCALKMRSPSFSRFSSSTTQTPPPLRREVNAARTRSSVVPKDERDSED